ncbi:hypothetical protein GCM10011571_18470 [Marinithermofilum abyssi]|uniref:Peptidase C51 domain-containing protein n=1 Tax=Marinithermofilum abyssi TaxID=1571185 RepID=A0A8J2YE28_9BACL|nr:CHAP domain-containing protein [Marinithermofilum abyssi]GGE17068.1 hypothetical protein GCM10011571_18470 [Marinithermofilum abyssi]
MKRKLVATVVASTLAFSALPPQFAHAESTSQSKQELKDINEQQDEVQKSIDELEKKIAPIKKKVTDLEKKMADTNKKINALEKDMKKNKKDLDKASAVFKERIRIMYQQGEMGTMEALLEADSFEEFLQRFEVLRIILKQDRNKFDQYYRLYEKKMAMKKKLLAMKKKQKEEADKARAEYEKINKEMEKTEKKLSSLNSREQSIKSRLEAAINIDASLYPLRNASTSGVDPWGFYNRQCTSFVAWRMNAKGVDFSNNMKGGHWGNGNHWDDNARALGYRVDNQPTVGSIAQWNYGGGGFGHVAYVIAVDGSQVTIEEYNWDTPYGYGKRTISASEPSNYIHIIN